VRRWWSSLTVRLLVASLTWTLGLLYITHLASVMLLFGPANAVDRFGHRIGPTSALALTLMVFGALIVRRALRSFGALRQHLLDVQEGRERLVPGNYVREVQPVVSALNALLEHQDRRVRDAMAKAGDLAHGLKTPLAVLGHEAERAAAAGHHELAATLWQQIERMRRHIDYHLAHARAAAAESVPGTRCLVTESASALARTLAQLNAQRGLALDVDAEPGLAVRVRREDLDEMLGNLLDNACRYARGRVLIAAHEDDRNVIITVDDDGPGLAAELRDIVLQRGVRADEAAPGSGFGLAIVRDLAEVYGGAVALDESPLGGLRARLRLPQATGDHSAPVQAP
jgi:signal transduction histidine kinase